MKSCSLQKIRVISKLCYNDLNNATNKYGFQINAVKIKTVKLNKGLKSKMSHLNRQMYFENYSYKNVKLTVFIFNSL